MTEAIIETERLILRRFRPDDLDAYHAIFSHPEVARWLLPIATREDALRSMAMVEGFWSLYGTSFMAVEEKASGALAGRCGPWHLPAHEGARIEVGWTIGPAHQRRGFAAEAGRAAIAYAFERFDVGEVVHVIEEDNAASQAVARALGATPTDETFVYPPGRLLRLWASRRSGGS